MATSGQDQVDVRLAPRPAQEWTEEDVAHFFKEMDIRDSVIETFKGKRNIANFLLSMKLAAFSQRKRWTGRGFCSRNGLKLNCLIGRGNTFH